MHGRRHTPHAASQGRSIGSPGPYLHRTKAAWSSPPWGPLHQGYHTPHARVDRSGALRGPGLSTGPRMHCPPPGARCIRGTTRHTPGTSIGRPGGSWPLHRANDALTSLGPDALEKGLTTRLTRSIGSMRGSRPFLHRLCSIVLPDA